MRTDQEILDRIEVVNLAGRDWLRTERTDLISRLPHEAAKRFLKPEFAAPDEWVQSPRDRESLIAEMAEYMPFAWDKANNGRGISAGRSLSHFSAWIWLAGDDLGDLNDYEFYGKDNLARICAHYGWDSRQWDDGERHN